MAKIQYFFFQAHTSWKKERKYRTEDCTIEHLPNYARSTEAALHTMLQVKNATVEYQTQ